MPGVSPWTLQCLLQVQAAHESTAAAQEALQSAQEHEESLLQQRAVLDGELLGAKKREGQLHKKVRPLPASCPASQLVKLSTYHSTICNACLYIP